MKKIWLTLWLAGLLPAHDLYLMPERFAAKPGEILRLVFQNGDEFPEASSPVNPSRLRNTQLRSKAGTAPMEKITGEKTRTVASVRIPGPGLAILTAQTLPNFIELDPAKFKSYLEHENLTGTLAYREKNGETGKPGRERYSKYVKSMLRVGTTDDYFRQRTGLTIEIVPEVDPYSLRPGDTLPVQVLFRGKPAADVAVESAWLEGGKAKMDVVGRTDHNGRVKVPVHANGPHRLHAIVMERCAEPKAADWESFWASLTFGIGAKD
ncbi:MAG TPA: DUF4198 domain-containing protein [Bryobacteraceae bacterium]|nr:DUF4198 domain-containing protein [Bryobacteraceae bacterium]